MRCPSLAELPPPPGKTGWPWTEETPRLPDTMPDGSPWPKISIVTSSYNQGQFIEETIRSVLLQGYPNLNYVIIDGDSTDNSVEIIKKYQQWLSYWISEPDNGQANALNKGFKKTEGNILAFINSDDLYQQEAFLYAASFFIENQPGFEFLIGQTEFINDQSVKIKGFEELFSIPLDDFTMTECCHIPQPSTFFHEKVFSSIGFFDENLHYSFDYDFWLRGFLAGLRFKQVRQSFSRFRLHNSTKGTTGYAYGKFDQDFIYIYQKALSLGCNPKIKNGLRKGLANAACSLFAHVDSTQSNSVARRYLLKTIAKNPEILLVKNIWPTFLASLFPNSFRMIIRLLKKKSKE